MPPRLVVVRHGETAWSKSGRHTGRTDLALLPEGEAMARALGPRLAAEGPFALVLTSPLQRARSTAALAGYPTAVNEPNLMEWDYGADEGRTTSELQAERVGWDSWRDGYAGAAETVAEVAARADAVIERARSTDGTVLVFAHNHLLSVLAARWIGLTPSSGSSFTLAPAGLGVLTFRRIHPVIERWNA